MNDKIAIIPQPQSLTVTTGAPFRLHAATEISGAGSGRIVLQCDFAAERDESYSLIVSEKQVRLAAAHRAVLFYGCQILVQLLQPAATRGTSRPSTSKMPPALAGAGHRGHRSRHCGS